MRRHHALRGSGGKFPRKHFEISDWEMAFPAFLDHFLMLLEGSECSILPTESLIHNKVLFAN